MSCISDEIPGKVCHRIRIARLMQDFFSLAINKARVLLRARAFLIHRHSLNLHPCRLRTTEDTTEDTASASSASPAIIPVIAVIAVIAAVALVALMTLASVLLIPLVAL